MKPTLGFSSAEDTRENWKQSKLVVSIPMVSFLLQYKKDLEAEAGGGSCSWFFEYWPVFTSFVLNVLEDHDPKFKEAGCGMLSLMILLDERISKSDETVFIKSGLVDVFNDAAKVCLSYLPNLTPVEVSDRLLTAAYGVIIPLIRMKRESVAGKRLRYVQLLNENILSSIQHISSSNSSHPVLITLLKQISILIKLDPLFIFIPLTRLLFTINQIMTNPITLEDHAHGYLVIEECLKIQSHVLNKNTLPYDKVACALILQYKYDFLAVSCVLYLRLTKYHQHNQHIIQIIKRNVILLEEIYKEVEPIQWINDIEKICSRDNQLYPLFKVLM